jgi:hypothetical protein
MKRKGSIVIVALLVVLLASAGEAQPPAPQPNAPPAVARTVDRADLRRQIYVMEGALAAAVEFGAMNLNRELRSVMPEMMALSGQPQARGVYLEGYGVYFDVAVPVLNQMMVLSLRTMLGPDENVVAALDQLKAFARTEKNPSTRASIENAISRIELQLGPLAEAPASSPFAPALPRAAEAVGAAAMVSPETAGDTARPAAPPPGEPTANRVPRPKLDKRYFQDPNAVNQAYTESVQDALMDAIIDYGVMKIAPEEFLTVAARDNMHRDSLAPPDPYEEIVTILLSIKGSDLAAFRAGQIDAAEVRKRIQLREF